MSTNDHKFIKTKDLYDRRISTQAKEELEKIDKIRLSAGYKKDDPLWGKYVQKGSEIKSILNTIPFDDQFRSQLYNKIISKWYFMD